MTGLDEAFRDGWAEGQEGPLPPKGMTCLVYCKAAPMGSKRIGNIKGRAVILDDKDVKLRSFQSEVKEAMREVKPAEPHLGPISLHIVFWMKRPGNHFGSGKNANVLKGSAPIYPCVSPDWDKVARAICDCGTGIWFRDDKQIVKARVEKNYVEQGNEERVWIQAKCL